MAGHSLGEYTAAAAVGALPIEDGMRLVARRGQLMRNIRSSTEAWPRSSASTGPRSRSCPPRRRRTGSWRRPTSPSGCVVGRGGRGPASRRARAERGGQESCTPAGRRRVSQPHDEARAGGARAGHGLDPLERSSGAAGEQRQRHPHHHGRAGSAGSDRSDSPARLWVDCVATLRANGCRTFLELRSPGACSASSCFRSMATPRCSPPTRPRSCRPSPLRGGATRNRGSRLDGG